MRCRFATLGVLALAACHHRGAELASGPPLASEATVFPIACRAGVVELASSTVVFGPTEVDVVRGTRISAHQPNPASGPWLASTRVEIAGSPPFAVGLAGGRLWRVDEDGRVDPLPAAANVVALASGNTTTAFATADQLVIARDSTHGSALPIAGATSLAATTDRIAIGSPRGLEILDLTRGTRTRFADTDATSMAFSPMTAALIVATPKGLFIDDGRVLHRVDRDAHAIAVGGERVWILGAALRSISLDAGARANTLEGVGRDARLCGATRREVWIEERGRGTRLVPFAPKLRETWEREVAPAFARACARCHGPDGEAHLDLSTFNRWLDERDRIAHQLSIGAMPPAASPPLETTERDALNAWLAR